MKDKIIEILGSGIEPERAECMAQQILDLYNESCPSCESTNSRIIMVPRHKCFDCGVEWD